MNPSTIRLLHVEDDRIQQSLFARHLSTLPEYRFKISNVANENQAVDAFEETRFDMVILDYQLDQGNGLNCLRRLRVIDPIVPVIAVSGVASSEIAADLIKAGADDYLAKQSLDSQSLAQSVRNTLTRAKAIRARFSPLAQVPCVASGTRA